MKRPIPVVFDTSELIAQNFGFRDRSLSRVSELCSFDCIQFITTPFLDDEIVAHIRKSASVIPGAINQFKKEAKLLRGTGRANPLDELRGVSAETFAADEIAKYKAFKNEVRAASIHAGHVDPQVVREWFNNGEPPFKAVRDPSSFVDAMVLSAVIRWAETISKHVHLVSRDDDWHYTANGSPSLTCHLTTNELIAYVEKARPLEAFGGDRSRLTEHLSNSSPPTPRHYLSDFPLVQARYDGFTSETREIEIDTFGDLVNAIDSGEITLTTSSKGARIVAPSRLSDKSSAVVNKFPQRLGMYQHVRESNEHKLLSSICKPDWSGEFKFYAAWMMLESEQGSLPTSVKLGGGHCIPDVSTYVETLKALAQQAPAPEESQRKISELRAIYQLYVGSSEARFKIHSVNISVSLGRTG